jgi:ribosomal protein L33
MAWQKNKIILDATIEETLPDGTVKKVYVRYLTTKSKGRGKPTTKLKLKKYSKVLNRRVLLTESKYK